MTTLEAGFNMPWYVWAWLIIIFWFGWPTLVPDSFSDISEQEKQDLEKHQIPLIGVALVPKAVTDFKLWSEHNRKQRTIFDRLKKGDKIVEGDIDFEIYTLMRKVYEQDKANR